MSVVVREPDISLVVTDHSQFVHSKWLSPSQIMFVVSLLCEGAVVGAHDIAMVDTADELHGCNVIDDGDVILAGFLHDL